MTMADTIIVRYSAGGHARFQLPQALCTAQAGQQLTMGLRQLEGIYRVDLYGRQRKLSVRYSESIRPFQTLVEALRTLVEAGIPSSRVEESCCSAGSAHVESKAAGSTETEPKPGLMTKSQHDRETSTALRFVSGPPTSRAGMLGPIKEKTVIEFFNDVLVLFLIKLHWHMITQHWLRQPWRYRYEWMAAIYLIYLLVRSRRPKP